MEHGYAPVRRREPVRGRRLRHRLQAEGHPQLRDERAPAQLLRRAGLRRQRQRQPARRRRDLERGQLRHPPGADRQARRRRRRRRSSPAPAAQRPADQCPGNRRWMQIVFDAYLLMAPEVSMLDSRDAYLAADRMRFGGANQAELWTAFARARLRREGGLAGPDARGRRRRLRRHRQPRSGPELRVPAALGREHRDVQAPVDERGDPLDGELLDRRLRGQRHAGRRHGSARPALGAAVEAASRASTRSWPARTAAARRSSGARSPPASSSTSRVTMPANRASTANGATAAGEGATTARSSTTPRRPTGSPTGGAERGRRPGDRRARRRAARLAREGLRAPARRRRGRRPGRPGQPEPLHRAAQVRDPRPARAPARRPATSGASTPARTTPSPAACRARWRRT